MFSTYRSNLVAVGSNSPRSLLNTKTPLGPGHAFKLTIHVDVSTEHRVFSDRFSCRQDLAVQEVSHHHHQHQLAVVPPSVERPQQFVEQDVPQPTHPPSVLDAFPMRSTAIPWIISNKHRLRDTMRDEMDT